mmetsp:Transcript_8355/g.12703  ORF Transcript_8355/g.12703 Transcript_8355/m.12703 type:complete len:170 (+) Transcript_8355:872-1381(+)
MTLRKNLFKLLRVAEFSKQTQFRLPGSAAAISQNEQNAAATRSFFLLPDVICMFCSTARDLDLLRDPNLLANDWTCIHCGHAYDRLEIEARLVGIVEKKSVGYQLQDIQCVKCKLIKDNQMSEICTNCCGKLKLAERESLQHEMQVFQLIATFHSFEWLKETIQYDNIE